MDPGWFVMALIGLLCVGLAVSGVTLVRGILRYEKRKEIEAGHQKRETPVCGCGHHRSFHTDGAGCKHIEQLYNVTTESVRRYGVLGRLDEPRVTETRTHTGEAECPCGGYIGPEPMPTLYAAEITEAV